MPPIDYPNAPAPFSPAQEDRIRAIIAEVNLALLSIFGKHVSPAAIEQVIRQVAQEEIATAIDQLAGQRAQAAPTD